MPSYNVIVCPTDLSPDADAALGTAAELAASHDANLIVVYWTANDAEGSAGHVAGLFEESVALNVRPSLLGSLRWEGITVTGRSAAEAIAEAAAARHADLIVMRSRRRPLGAVLLGSTAESVSRIAPCPVLITHSGERDRQPDGTRIERILVAYDFWDDSEIALQHALRLATEHGAEVHLLHAVPAQEADSPELSWLPLGTNGQLHRIERRLLTAVPHAAALGVRVIPHVVEGHAYREILSFAESNDIDLICLGARGRDFGARSLFGSNSDRVLRQAPCPVLVARPLKPALGAPVDRSMSAVLHRAERRRVG
jgi:nucleotide-binding universal stress UspA family protein